MITLTNAILVLFCIKVIAVSVLCEERDSGINYRRVGKIAQNIFERHKNTHIMSQKKHIQTEVIIGSLNRKERVAAKNIDFYNQSKPNLRFRKHGISESKCLEYIQEEKYLRNSECKHIEGTNCSIASLHQFPHMGVVGWLAKKGHRSHWIFLCSSFLISDRFLLTAAHCYSLDSADERIAYPYPKIVRLGLDDTESPYKRPVFMKIKKFIRYPQYRFPMKYYDIALIELQDKVRFSEYIQPACLWNKFRIEEETTAVVTGWGDGTEKNNKASIHLKVTHVDLVQSAKCDRMLVFKKQYNWSGVKNHQVCASTLNGSANVCQGDSGGPLQIKVATNSNRHIYRVIGVASFGFGCGMSAKYPDIYTRISTFIHWIEQKVWSRSRYDGQMHDNRIKNETTRRHKKRQI